MLSLLLTIAPVLRQFHQIVLIAHVSLGFRENMLISSTKITIIFGLHLTPFCLRGKLFLNSAPLLYPLDFGRVHVFHQSKSQPKQKGPKGSLWVKTVTFDLLIPSSSKALECSCLIRFDFTPAWFNSLHLFTRRQFYYDTIRWHHRTLSNDKPKSAISNSILRLLANSLPFCRTMTTSHFLWLPCSLSAFFWCHVRCIFVKCSNLNHVTESQSMIQREKNDVMIYIGNWSSRMNLHQFTNKANQHSLF